MDRRDRRPSGDAAVPRDERAPREASTPRDASTPREPLGPRREAPYDPELLRGLLLGEPTLLPALPRPVASASASRLYLIGEAARACVLERDGVASLSASTCVLGAFDGVHVGHRALVAAAVKAARARAVPAVAVTFDPDPARVLAGPADNAELLGVGERLRVLASLGVDALLVVPFTPELARMSHESFLTDVLAAAVSPLEAHVGSNFRMGAGGLGTVEALAAFARPLGVSVRGHDLACADGAPVSATRIRSLVRQGEVAEAARLLRRPHAVRGTVVHGRGEGTSFGFPTANVELAPVSCRPAEGVYAAVAVAGGHAWPAAVNVGAPRSFGGQEGVPFLEATLLGFSGDLYGSELAVCFVEWLREPRSFSSLAELEGTVLGNVEWVRRYVGEGDLLAACPREAPGPSRPGEASELSRPREAGGHT